MSSTRNFFRALWDGVEGFAELRIKDQDTNRCESYYYEFPARLDELVAHALRPTNRHVWFGACLRDKRRGTNEDVQVATAVWVDIDFKATAESEARQKLKALPFLPSIGILSGGGCHLYYLLREPATDLKRVVEINRALASVVGGDIRSTPIGHLLRVPGTLNPKYDPPAPCRLTQFHPERRYNLGDFDFLPPPDQPKRELSMGQATVPGVAIGSCEIAPELKRKLAPLIQKIWIEGHRHTAALFLSGALAKHGISLESTRELIEAVCRFSGDEEIEDRLRAVDETFELLRTDPTHVGGFLRFERDVIEQLPETLRQHAKRILKVVEASIKEIRKDDDCRGTKIELLEKVDTIPARWSITIVMDEKTYALNDLDTDTLTSISKLRRAFFEHYRDWIPLYERTKWERMLKEAPFQVVQIDSKESTQVGYLEQTIVDFEGKAQSEKAGEMALQVAPVRLDSGEIVVRLQALLRYLKAEGTELKSRSDVINGLRRLGYRPYLKRLGSTVTRVWVKSPKADNNGSGHTPTELFDEGRDA